jgi:hypothetical protein
LGDEILGETFLGLVKGTNEKVILKIIRTYEKPDPTKNESFLLSLGEKSPYLVKYRKVMYEDSYQILVWDYDEYQTLESVINTLIENTFFFGEKVFYFILFFLFFSFAVFH